MLEGGPGCLATCGSLAAGSPGGPAAVLAPLLLLVSRRRKTLKSRRFFDFDFDFDIVLALASVLLLALLLSPRPARADEAGDLAIAAYQLRAQYCTDAALADPGKAYSAQGAIWPVQQRINDAVLAGGPTYLRYWRALLGLCIGRGELAEADLQGFIDAEGSNPTFASLVEDAQRRLRRLRPQERANARDPSPRRGAAATSVPAALPRLAVGLGAGMQRLPDWNYLLISADLQLRLAGPLHGLVLVQPSIGQALRPADTGSAALPRQLPILTTLGPGVSLRFAPAAAPLRPELGFAFLVAPNPARAATASASYAPAGGAVLAGPLFRRGLAIPFGSAPLSFRIGAEGGYLHPYPFVRAVGSLVIGG